jgi:dTDP-6-deoxy-L-talose 4-dehydrogenase (NAD+)
MRDYLPVEQVANYIVRVAGQKEVTGIINVCSGQPVTVQKLVEDHLQKVGKTITLNLGHYPYTDYEPMRFWGDTTKLQMALTEPGGDSESNDIVTAPGSKRN